MLLCLCHVVLPPGSTSLPLLLFSIEGNLTTGPGSSGQGTWGFLKPFCLLCLHSEALWGCMRRQEGRLSLGKCFSISDLRDSFIEGGGLNGTRCWHSTWQGWERPQSRLSPAPATQCPNQPSPMLHTHGQALCKLFARRWLLV